MRGGAAFKLTRAANTGCGLACTIHANSASDALEALVNAALMAGENVPERVVLVAMTARSGAFRDFYSSSTGLLVVLVGGLMSLVGVVIASRLGAQPAEPRVFKGGHAS